MVPKEKLPELKEVTIELELDEARRHLQLLPSNLERIRSKLEKAIERAETFGILEEIVSTWNP